MKTGLRLGRRDTCTKQQISSAAVLYASDQACVEASLQARHPPPVGFCLIRAACALAACALADRSCSPSRRVCTFLLKLLWCDGAGMAGLLRQYWMVLHIYRMGRMSRSRWHRGALGPGEGGATGNSPGTARGRGARLADFTHAEHRFLEADMTLCMELPSSL